MNRFDNKVVVITGGNSGIGLATAKRPAAEGAKVVISGRDEATLASAAKEIGGDVLAVRADVAKPADIDRLIHETKSKHGKIDVLFANAGVAPAAPLEAVTEAHFDEVFAINVKGLYLTVQKALPLLSEGAAIVLNASVVDQKGLAGWAELFAEGAVVEDPVGSPAQVGPTAIRAFFAGILARFQSFGLTEDHVFVAGDTAAVKWTARGLTLGGRVVAFEGIDILTVDAEGMILSLRAYWDPAPWFAILAAEASASS